jgi:uroporphyrinogen-III synthase
MPLEELSGFVVGVTADGRAEEQIAMLERRGATVIHGPAIRTHPLRVDRVLADAIEDLIAHPPEVTVLSTGIGVRGVIEAAEVLGRAEALVDALAGSRVHVRGPKAHGAAVTVDLPVAWGTSSGMSSEVLEELGRRGIAGVRIALQLDGAAQHPLAEALVAAGADLVTSPVYRWSLPDDLTPVQRLAQAVIEGPDAGGEHDAGRTVEHWHTRTKTGRVEILDRLAPQGWVEVHPTTPPRCRCTPATSCGSCPSAAPSTASACGPPAPSARARCSCRSTSTRSAPTA